MLNFRLLYKTSNIHLYSYHSLHVIKNNNNFNKWVTIAKKSLKNIIYLPLTIVLSGHK